MRCLFGIAVLIAGAALAAPLHWIPRGPGGGGAFYGPAISPFSPAEYWVKSDMSDYFRTRDGGQYWSTLDFRQLQGGNLMTGMQFTSDPLILYALSGSAAMKSTNGGRTWMTIPYDAYPEGVYSVWADPQATDRLLVSTYGELYFSSDGGQSYGSRYTASDLHMAGVFWDGATIYAGARAGLLVSTNAGASFALAGYPGISNGEAMVSFVGAQAGGMTRLFCVTFGSADVYPGVQGYDYYNYRRVYRLDVSPGASWQVVTNGVGDNMIVFVSMCRTNVDVVYLAGASDYPNYPAVLKSVNGGAWWTSVLLAANNQNVATGWQGQNGDRGWGYGECALGFQVAPLDPAVALISDYGFVHATTNGGASWHPVYVHPESWNAMGANTPKNKQYQSVGLEDTSCWWLLWLTSQHVLAGYTDIMGSLSTNGGVSWGIPAGLTFNSMYQAVRNPSNGWVYAAASSVHDLYAWDRYCRDSSIDSGNGAIIVSTNNGLNWQTLHGFGRPVVSLAFDPNNLDRLYASVVHSGSGGIYRTVNLSAGAGATWTKLASPPRTEGHPYLIHVLNDGTLVCSYSARIASDFTDSSGVFVSTNEGAGWIDRTAPGMRYYTKDIVIDPHDASQNRWYAGVWGEWGSSSGHGGLYTTTNRGVAWTRITTGLDQVGSCTINPWRSNEMFVCTENQGLWISTNRLSPTPSFSEVKNYPFKFPSRVFCNPFDTNEVWILSFGNGMKMGRWVEPAPSVSFESVGEPDRVRVDGAAGQNIRLERSSSLMGWNSVTTGRLVGSSIVLPSEMLSDIEFYRAVVETNDDH